MYTEVEYQVQLQSNTLGEQPYKIPLINRQSFMSIFIVKMAYKHRTEIFDKIEIKHYDIAYCVDGGHFLIGL